VISRRRFLTGFVIALAPAATVYGAQEYKAGKIYQGGVLDPGRVPDGTYVPGFREGLRELGYIEGQTIVVDLRFAGDDPARIPVLAAELVRKTPDVLWTHSPQGSRAATQATPTIPIVVGVARYLVEQGLAVSLARPGGNRNRI
jgi:putative ABC transport system substrate-binding protein